MTALTRAALLLTAVSLAACGGSSKPAPPPTAATLRLSVAGVPAGTALAGAEVRLRLPAGVTPRLAAIRLAEPLTAATAELFAPAWDAGTRTLRLAVASKVPAGLAGAALVDVECDVTAAAAPAAADYQVAGFTAADLSVTPVVGATLAVSASYR